MRKRGFESISQQQIEMDFEGDDFYINLPRRATAHSAGYDIFAPFDIEVGIGESITIPTGLKSYMQSDEVLKIYPRSGHGFKNFIRLANTVGIVDSDYYDNRKNEGHIFIKIRNEGKEKFEVRKGDAFAQAIFEKYLLVDDDSFDGEKRVGGMGSTNK